MADLPPSLRRAANNQAVRHRPPQPGTRLYDAADTGLLTNSNTKKGTRGRQAVDAVTYRRRRAAEPTLSAREALGQRVAGTRTRIATFYTAGPPRTITVEGISLSDVRRAGDYLHSVRTLIAQLRRHPSDAQRIKRAWERRVARRAPIAGYPLLATADAAIALAEENRAAGEEPSFDSGRSRPGRRRRRPSRRRRR